MEAENSNRITLLEFWRLKIKTESPSWKFGGTGILKGRKIKPELSSLALVVSLTLLRGFLPELSRCQFSALSGEGAPQGDQLVEFIRSVGFGRIIVGFFSEVGQSRIFFKTWN